MNGIEPRSIRYFIAVAERLNFNAASEELHITQPALTKSIQKLEELLEVSLFDRHPRGLELTPYGEVFLRHAKSIQSGYAHAIREINHIRDATKDVITMGAGPSWSSHLLPDAIASLSSKYPMVLVRVISDLPEELVPQVRTGAYDFAVAALSDHWLEEQANPNFRDLEIVPLMADDMCVVARDDHPVFSRANVTLADLEDYPWIGGLPNSIQARLLARLFAAEGLAAPHPVAVCNDITFRLSMLLRGDFLTFTSSRIVRDALHQGLRPVGIRGSSVGRAAGMILRRHATLSTAAQFLASEIRRLAAEVAQEDDDKAVAALAAGSEFGVS